MSQDFTTRPIELAKHFGLGTVVTNDVHFPSQEQAEAHRIMTKCRKGYTYESTRLWLKSFEELEDIGSTMYHSWDVSRWLRTTLDIAEMVEPWNMYAEPKLPTVEDAEAQLKNLLITALRKDIEGRSKEE